MTDEQLTARGWSIPIYRAVELAGGATAVAAAMGLKSMTAVMAWYKNGSMKARYINGLCALAGNKVTPQEILDDLAKRQSMKVAA